MALAQDEPEEEDEQIDVRDSNARDPLQEAIVGTS